MLFFCVSLLHPHTLFSLNHQLNCIADSIFYCFHCICLLPCCCCWYALFLLEFMQFLLCRSRELSAFISRFLSSLPAEYFAMFSCSFFLDILVHLFWLPFRDEILIRFSHSHNFITTTTFPQNNNSEKLKMSINSFLFCYVAHHTLSPCLFACFSCFFHQYRQLQAAPSSTNSILHNVLLEKRDNVMTSKQFPPPGDSS